jgi:hypothetical protein
VIAGHFTTKSAIHSLLRPLKDCVTGSASESTSADVSEQRPGARAVPAGIAARKAACATELAAKLDEEVRRRYPAQLHAVVVQPPAEEGFVRERRILEVPGVLVELVLVADPGKEAAALQREPAPKRERLEEGLLHLELVFRRKRRDELAPEKRVDVAADDEFRFGEAEAPPRWLDFATRRRKSADLVGLGVSGAACRGPLQD